ncbi:MAG: MFS transporter [Rhodobacterales bacterium]|nr:MFS transporter [Rhodobacterales bacterium]
MAEISARKRIWGWFFFDWASQPYHTVLMTFIFGPFFVSVASAYYMSMGMGEDLADANAQSYWSLGQTFIGLFIGICAPFLGAMADTTGRRRPWIYLFSLMYVVGAAGLWWSNPDGSNLLQMILVFGVGFIGAEFALIFVNAQLPLLGSKEEIGKISGSGFAFGYIGGLIALAIMLALFVAQPNGKTLIGLDPALGLDPAMREGTRLAGPVAALWYLVFMVPYFLWVKVDRATGKKASASVALSSIMATLRGLRHRASAAAYLGSSMFYRDALNGLYAFGGTYASLVLNWNIVLIGVFGIISGSAAALFSWLGGKFDSKFGPKPVIITAIWFLMFVVLVIVNMTRESLFGFELAEGSNLPDIIFFGCGMLIGGMGGILQAASRTLMTRHTTPDNATESFGLYGLSGRATAFLAPALIFTVTTMTGSARLGVSPLIGLFLIGLFLLRWVKPEGESEQWETL